MEMSPSAETPQETIARLLFEWCQLLQRLKRALWRCVSPVSDGQDCLYPKYPTHPANVVGLIGFVMWGLKTYFSFPHGTCVPSGTEGFTVLPLQIYLLLSFCLSHLSGLVFLWAEQHGLICAGWFNNQNTFGVWLASKGILVWCCAQSNKSHFSAGLFHTILMVQLWLLALRWLSQCSPEDFFICTQNQDQGTLPAR